MNVKDNNQKSEWSGVFLAHSIIFGLLLGPITYAVFSKISMDISRLSVFIIFGALELALTIWLLKYKTDPSVKSAKLFADFIWNFWAAVTVLAVIVSKQDPSLNIKDAYSMLGFLPLSVQSSAIISIFYVAILRLGIVMREGIPALKPRTKKSDAQGSDTSISKSGA